MDYQNQQRGRDIQQSHKGYQFASNHCDTFNTAQQHGAYQYGHNQSADQCGHCKVGFQHLGNRIRLHCVGQPKACQGTKQGKSHTQPFPVAAEAIFNIVHGAAYFAPQLIGLAIIDRQHRLGILGSHTHKGSTPHPEKRPWATQTYGSCHPGDITHTYGG